MKTILGFFCSFFLMNIAFSQKLYLTDHPIYLDVINQYIQVYSKKDSSILTNKGDQDKNYIKVFDLTPRGSMKFIFHDTSSKIIVFGHYKEALKLSKPKGYTREGPRVRTKQGGISEYYYKPFRDGVWYFYDNNGKLLKKHRYKSGVIIN